jgi:hypothetical protein
MRSNAQFVEQAIDETDIAAPSPAAIAAGVKMTAKHESLAAKIAELEAERAACLDEMRGLLAGPRDEAGDSRIRRLGKALWPLSQEIRPLRDAHIAAVRKALEQSVREAGKSMVAALAMFATSVNFLNQCEDHVERAGGEASRIYYPTNFGALEIHARHIAGLGDRDHE